MRKKIVIWLRLICRWKRNMISIIIILQIRFNRVRRRMRRRSSRRSMKMRKTRMKRRMRMSLNISK